MSELMWGLWLGLLAMVVRMETKHLGVDKACGKIDTAKMTTDAAGPLLGKEPRDELREFGRGAWLRMGWFACAAWLAAMVVMGKEGLGG